MKNSKLYKKIVQLLLSLRGQALTPEGSQKILTSFDQKVARAGGIGLVVRKLKVMFEYFRHPKTSLTKKGLVGAALLYFILPTDVIVDVIPFVGYIDDMTAALFVWNLLSKELEKFEQQMKQNSHG
jgi:uncharacterized membrane protein YkvA (DUF1232 family)